MGHDLAVGDVVGRYRILGVLGRGGVGVTYEAELVDGRGHVAVKQLALARMDDWKVLELFEREARVLAAVEHPAVPGYLEYFAIGDGPDGPAFYLVQQLAPGRSLADLVTGGWRAEEAEARRIAAAVLEVLAYLHRRTPPVFHRDIKPQNLLREADGKMWLVDFGAVRDVYRTATVGGSTVVGTYGYMAPEQLRGVARPESDLYGLGATLLFVLTGQPPTDLPQRGLVIDFRSKVRVSPGFAAWLERMLAPAPEDRFPSAEAARAALHDARLCAPRSRPRQTRVRVLIAALGVAVVGLAGGLKWGRTPRPAPAVLALLPGRPPVTQFSRVRHERTLPAHYSAVMSVAFTPDGNRLISSSWDATAKIWNRQTGEPVAALPGHHGPVGAVRITPDGRQAVSAGDRTLRFWRLPEGEPAGRVFADPARVYSAAVAPSGQTIASGGTDGRVRLWSIEGAAGLELSHGKGRVFGLAFSPDGSRLASAGDDPTIRVWDVTDGTLVRTLAGHTATVNSLAFTPDGQTLVSASDDHTAKVWHLGADAPLATLSLHADEVWAVALSPNGTTLVTGGKDATLGVWGLPGGKLKESVALNPAMRGTLALAFAPDGASLAAGHGAGQVVLWGIGQSSRKTQLPHVTIAPVELPGDATPEQRAYAEATNLIDGYEGVSEQLDAAEALLQQLRTRNPRSALAHAGLARVAFKRAYVGGQEYEPAGLGRARAFADQALALDGALVEALIVRGWALRAGGDAAGARAAVAQARSLAPSAPRVLLLVAELALDRGDVDAAEAALHQAVARPLPRPLAAAVFATLDDVYQRRGDIEAADEAYRRHIDLEPESAWAKGNYAHFLVAKGDADAAIAMAQKALEQMRYGAAERTLAEAYCAKGEALLWERGDADGAAQMFHHAARAWSDHACAAYGLGAYHQYLGVTHTDRGHLNEARRAFRQAVTLDPDHTLARGALAALGR